MVGTGDGFNGVIVFVVGSKGDSDGLGLGAKDFTSFTVVTETDVFNAVPTV